jgi:RNA polymerase subunit RPABC4/transcription elongation factor Spt4
MRGEINDEREVREMALIKCFECGQMISSAASACPHCGAPVPKKMIPMKVERKRLPYGQALGTNVYVDGALIGSCGNGQTINTEIQPGRHNIVINPSASNIAVPGASQSFTVEESNKYVEIDFVLGGTFVGKITIKDIRIR